MGFFDAFNSGGPQLAASGSGPNVQTAPSFGAGFQPSRPVSPAGPLDMSQQGFQAPPQGFMAQMQQMAPGLSGLGQAMQGQPQQDTGPSLLQQQLQTLMQQNPIMSHPVIQSLFQLPQFQHGGR